MDVPEAIGVVSCALHNFNFVFKNKKFIFVQVYGAIVITKLAEGNERGIFQVIVIKNVNCGGSLT